MKVLLIFLSLFNCCVITIAQIPSIRVLDTDFSKGRLANQQTITLDDATKFHGHLCDGLVVGFLGLREALYKIYPDSIIDRTNTRIVSKSSPCLTDVAIYLTGGRYQFNTYYVSDSISAMYIVQRIDNGKAVSVKLKNGVKPAIIDGLGSLAAKGELTPCQLDSLRKYEGDFTSFLLKSNPNELYEISDIPLFHWQPYFSNGFIKTDIVNKNQPGCMFNKK
jgi:acetolactate decarboxylase